jgi:S1-C subfamily serine protease
MRGWLVVCIFSIAASFGSTVVAEPSLDSSGTGFFVSYDGHVLTNYHVADGCSLIRIVSLGAAPLNSTVVAKDKNNDLALLRYSGKPAGVPAFRSETRLGESIYVFGFPLTGLLSSAGNFAVGTVTGLTGPGDDSQLLQISASVYPGNSGGPLIDKFGNVVGIIVGRITSLQNVNYAIKSSVAVNFLSSNRLTPRAEATSRELPAEAIADLANSFTVRVLCYKGSEVAQGSDTSRAGGPYVPAPVPNKTNPCAGRAVKRTLWEHNGSIVCLSANGDSRSFYYAKPRSGLIEAGAKPGDLLFSGKAVGMQYVGRAYIFKGGCGKFEYEVRGNILNNYSRVEMRGQAPRVDDNCNITGEIKDTLVFSLMDE